MPDKTPEKMNSSSGFDLNIVKILENWGVSDAIREVIANALDEQLLTGTKGIEITKKGRAWLIRDFGRGIEVKHLTQKENDEKLRNPHVIGKFGIGLKDALATFDRKKVRVLIRSKYGDITIRKSEKHGFQDILTLHAFKTLPSDPELVGTEFILDRVVDQDVARAKDLFLRFSGEKHIEDTEYGQVLLKKGNTARIYINGVKVAEEENFLFSYNITSITRQIRRALNRERTNVGRSAYSDRVKSILVSCKSAEVARRLAEDLRNYDAGAMRDELNWIDIQEHAVKILNATGRVLFATAKELTLARNMIDEAEKSRIEIVAIPESLKYRVRGKLDYEGKPIRVLDEFLREREESFEFKFIKMDALNQTERSIFAMTNEILDLIGEKSKVVRNVRISETMRRDPLSFFELDGLWDPETQTIIVKRSVLKSLKKYAGTLLHEAAHAESHTHDVSREFEQELTEFLGIVTSETLRDKSSP